MASDDQNDADADAQPSTTASRNGVHKAFARFVDEIGVSAVISSSLDVKLLLAQRFVRLFAYGGSVLVLVPYLKALDISAAQIGLFMTLTLAGDILISLVLTFYADRIGRKTILSAGAALVTASGLCFALSGNYWVLLAAAILGVISPAGNEIGPFRAIEESIIAHVTMKNSLGSTYAWYTLVGQAGTAFGMIVCGWLADTLRAKGRPFIYACRAVFFLYAAAGLIKLVLTLALSPAIEAKPKVEQEAEDTETEPLIRNGVSQPQGDGNESGSRKKSPTALGSTYKLVLSLTLFFGLDNFASGLIPLSWISYYFKTTFDLGEGTLGSIFFTTSIIAAISSLVAASIARRLGNIRTMVFTHLPSSVMLALIPVPSDLPLALTFLIGRSCTQQMDVAPRSAFLALVLPTDQRTSIMGFLNVVKICSTTIGPVITGSLVQNGLFWVAFVIAGCCKASYDLGMLATFAGVEKRAEP